jgi:hypothetical protein
MVRYKGTDQLLIQYYALAEASYGAEPSGAYNMAAFGYPTELVPQFDPELTAVHVLRTGASAGLPIRLLSKKSNVRLRLQWLQPTMAVYAQKELFTDLDNLYLLARVYRDASNYFFIKANGVKCNVLTVSGSIGEPLQWSMELIGKAMDTPAAPPGTPTYADEPTADPWLWKDCYLQFDSGGGFTLFPDVTDFEIRVEFGLKPIFVFNSTASLELTALENTVIKPSARITANLQSETQLDWLLGLTEVDLKLVLPDSKHITLLDGKFKSVEPTLKPEDLLAQRLEFEVKSWSHGFT